MTSAAIQFGHSKDIHLGKYQWIVDVIGIMYEGRGWLSCNISRSSISALWVAEQHFACVGQTLVNFCASACHIQVSRWGPQALVDTQ